MCEISSFSIEKFKLDNERYRYLLPEEEPVLMSVLTGKREHLKGMIAVALGLGLRKREQLNLRRNQVDFSRNVVVAAKTKGRKIEGLWWQDLRATFCTRLALAGYEALTIVSLMGHKDLKTTMRYIRAVQLQREVRPEQFVHKLATQQERPPMLAAVSF